MNITTQTEDSQTLITIHETRIDASIAPEFKSEMDQLIAESEAPIIVDISQISFMDSSSLGALVGIYKGVKQQDAFVIAGASGVVEELFKLTRMDSIFHMETSVEAAKQSFLSMA